MIKREFLANNKIKNYLQKNSLYSKLYKYKDKNSYMYKLDNFDVILEEYKKPLDWLKKVIVLSKEEITDKNLLLLKEITKDKRYKKEFLNLFGNPKNYEFDIKLVFERLHSIGGNKISLNLNEAMWSDLVFRVVLYRLYQLFLLSYKNYFIQKIKYKKIQKHHKTLLKCLKLSKKIFEKNIVEKLIKDGEDFSKLLDDKNAFERFTINLQTFIYEGDFFVAKKIPLYYLPQKKKLLKLLLH
jgi:hypothetical protein